MSIEAIAYAIPGLRHTAEDIAAQTGADAAFIGDKVGLRTRQLLGPGESGIALSVAACRRLMEANPALKPEEVGLLVCVTQNPDRRIPHNAPGIAHQLGLGHTVASFDISLGCSGYVYALEIVEGFLQRAGLKNAILVTCDPYSRIMASEDRDTNCIFGDAATATWVRSGAGRSETLAVDFGTDGGGADAIEIPAGGALRPLVSLEGEGPVASYGRDKLRLHMRGRAVYNFVMSRVPGSLEACLAKAGKTLDDMDWFALHQGSIYMLDSLARRVGIPQDKLLKNMDRYGNTVSSTIPLLLAELDERGALGGRTILLSGFGVGLSWASAVIRFHR
ncbi:MAG: ketoacyl-ACP synthase III [Burkholderiaceae bacterium]